MRRWSCVSVRGLLALAGVILLLVASNLYAAPPKKAVESPKAENLVRAALRAEVSGLRESREALLKEALDEAPDYGPANWHLGRIRVGNTWRSVDEVESAAARDPRLSEYRERLLNCPMTVADQIALATWCGNNRLDDQRKFHLANVVTLQPDHKYALRELGLRPYRDQWLPKEEVERRKEAAKRADEAMDHWKPILERWRKATEKGDTAERESALNDFRAVTDPAAFPAMELHFSEQSQSLGLEVVNLLTKMPQQEATESLVRHAVFCKFAAVRLRAADELKNRPRYNYVPLLLAGMAPLVESTLTTTFPTVHGGSHVEHEIYVKGADADLHIVHEMWTREQPVTITFLPWMALDGPPWGAIAKVDLPRSAQELHSNLQKANRARQQVNERIRDALVAATGVELPADPEQWWSWWRNYSGYEAPGYKPVYEYTPYEYCYPFRRVTPGQFTCVAWGTPVWTETGPVEVQRIKAGDRVLAQNPDTGELAYKIVLGATIRRLGKFYRFGLGDESIAVTSGHPFWVLGKGWRMAKQLEVGDRVHCLSGPKTIDRVEELPEDSAYNLVVADFNTYFAGRSRILLHDNTVPRPTTALVPGLLAERAEGQAVKE